MSSTLAERIKERLNIVDIVGQYVKLNRAGINHKGCCPFHHEKTPSFFVSESRQTYTCFGCGAKGDMLEFVQQFERLTFREALKVLFDKSGLPESDWDEARKKDVKEIEEDTKKKQALTAMEQAVKAYADGLWQSTRPLEYVRKRGLTDETIKNWSIGFAPESWQYIQARTETSTEALLLAGLIKTKEQSQETHRIHGHTYDFFRGRITFPIFDIQGKPVAISARIIDQGEPKYLNSPDTIIFNKSQTLYGLHKAKDGIRKWKFALLVEGQLDLLLCHQEGFDQAVATSGTALTDEHLRMLKRYTNNLMLVYDADQAGMKATIKAWTMALKHGLEVKVALLPKNEDPASLLLDRKGVFVQALKQAMHVIEYVLSKSDISSRSGKKDTLEKLIPLVAALDSSVDKEHFTNRIADRFEMSIDSIHTEISRYEMSEKQGYREGYRPGAQSVDALLKQGELVEEGGVHEPIVQALAELRALLYIYTQQLHSPDNTSQGVEHPDIYEKIKQYIVSLKEGHLGQIQSVIAPHITEPLETILAELDKKQVQVDEKLVYNLENIYSQKQVDIHFYEREIDIAYANIEQKIHSLVFEQVKQRLKKAELAKDKTDIDTFTEYIYKLSIHKHAKK